MVYLFLMLIIVTFCISHLNFYDATKNNTHYINNLISIFSILEAKLRN